MSALDVMLVVVGGVVLAAALTWLIVAGAAAHVRRGRRAGRAHASKRHHDR